MAVAVGRIVGVAVGVAGASVALGEADAEGTLLDSPATKREPGPEQATTTAARARGIRRSGDLMSESLLAGRRAVKVRNRTFFVRKCRSRCRTGDFPSGSCPIYRTNRRVLGRLAAARLARAKLPNLDGVRNVLAARRFDACPLVPARPVSLAVTPSTIDGCDQWACAARLGVLATNELDQCGHGNLPPREWCESHPPPSIWLSTALAASLVNVWITRRHDNAKLGRGLDHRRSSEPRPSGRAQSVRKGIAVTTDRVFEEGTIPAAEIRRGVIRAFEKRQERGGRIR